MWSRRTRECLKSFVQICPLNFSGCQNKRKSFRRPAVATVSQNRPSESASEMCSKIKNYKCPISSKLEVEDKKREQEMVEHLTQAVQI